MQGAERCAAPVPARCPEATCAFRPLAGQGVRPPPGLGVLPPPGLDLPPPPGLECSGAAAADTAAASCWRRGVSECSTTDSSEAASSTATSPREGTPAGPGTPQELASAAASWWRQPTPPAALAEQPERALYMPGQALLQAARGQPARTLQLSEALPQAHEAQDVPEVPSVGSCGHHLGLCKPCDFMHRDGGCRLGKECRFCHLCGPGMRRCWKKERKQLLSAQRRGELAAAAVLDIKRQLHA